MIPVAFLDANVLYRATTRSVLIYLALAGVCSVRWSDVVQDEWTRNLVKNRPDLNPQRIAGTRSLMDAKIPDAIVTGYEPLITTLTLPDPNDRHVTAAVIHARATVIVTENLSDFPEAALAPFSIVAQPPDYFVCALIEAEPLTALAAFARDRASMNNPPMTVDAYLAALEHSGLVATANVLRRFVDQL